MRAGLRRSDVPHAGPVPAVVADPVGAAVCALVSVLWMFTEPLLLLLLRQDPEVSRRPQHGGVRRAPGPRPRSSRSPSCSVQCLLRYLQTQSVVAPLVVCIAAPFALHVALANVLGMGLAGASAAISAAFWASSLMLLAYVLRSEPRRRSARRGKGSPPRP